MIVKRNFDPRKVATYVWRELLFSLLLSAAVYSWHTAVGLPPVVPFALLSMLGAALAIFLAFRNNTAFARWSEAAQLWYNIVNQVRILTRLTITFVDSHRHTPQYQAAVAEAFKQEMVYRLIAWAHALRMHLRGNKQWEELRPLLAADDYAKVLSAQHKPNALLLLQGQRIYNAMASGVLQGFDSFQMEGAMAQLSGLQASCERIKNIPIPKQYDYFTRLFVWVFIALTPFGLLGLLASHNLALWVIPLSALVAFVFTVLERTGQINEAPFENRITDVPLSALCRIIERDAREMLAETDLPPLLKPQDGYLW